MMVTTPPSAKCRQFRPGCRQKRPTRPYVYAGVYGFSTPGCGHQKRQFSEASNALSTLSTPYPPNNYIECGIGVIGPASRGKLFRLEGVDTRPTYHCLCGFTADQPGTCDRCKSPLYPRGHDFRDNPLFRGEGE